LRYSIYLLSMLMLVNLAGADVLINEMLANPAKDWNGNGQVGGMDDEFIELYNSGNESVDVSGYALRDKVFRSTPTEYSIPNGTVIGPGEFLVIFVSESGVYQGNEGDAIMLYDPTGDLVDEKEYDAATEDVSFARIPDGGEWRNSTAPSPGKPNQEAAS